MLIKPSVIAGDNKEEIHNVNNNINAIKDINESNSDVIVSIKNGKESLIMNDEIMNTIENDKNLLTNSILDINIVVILMLII